MAVAPCIVCLRIAPVRRGRFSAHRNSKPNKSCIMKKIFTLLAFAACCAAAAWSCSDEYDDSGLRQEIADIRQEIASMKEQVNSLKTLVDALNGNKFITNYTESDDGWSITFNDGKTITIRDGEKGADAPVLGIARFEGVYYWTLGALLRDGQFFGLSVFERQCRALDDEVHLSGFGQPDRLASRKDENHLVIGLPYILEERITVFADRLDRLAVGTFDRLAVDRPIALPSLDGDVLSITAPVEGNIYAEKSGKVTVVAVGATATVVAAVEVNLPVFDDNNAGSSDWEEWN